MYYRKSFERTKAAKGVERGSLILGISPIVQEIDEEDVTNLFETEHLELFRRKNKKRQKEYLTTRLMVKELVGADRQIRIENGILGNPVLTGDSLNRQISISHSKSYAAVLIGARDMIVGIDIEDILGRDREELNVALTDNELDFEEKFEDKESFKLTLWTAKEALSKFLRIGMTADWRIFEIASVLENKAGYDIGFRFFPDLKAYSSNVEGAVYSIICPGVEIS